MGKFVKASLAFAVVASFINSASAQTVTRICTQIIGTNGSNNCTDVSGTNAFPAGGVVVSTCGTPPTTYTAGTVQPITINTNGLACGS